MSIKADPPPLKTEAELIKGMLAGESSAFEMTVALYHNRMLTIARAIIGEAFAEEIVQDAWLSAIRSLNEFAGRSSLQTWLIQITANAAKTRLRREKRQVSLDENWQQIESDDLFDASGHWREHISEWDLETPEAILANDQLSDIIRQTFEKLPAQQQAVLTLYDLEGETMPQICNILGISASNARVLLHRARSVIHQQIHQYQEND
ncbi:RNA polymerase sigma factor [Methylophaga pinxianii]|uniref:RNA polymerase sigma factor n=1 Tax=Methylophaga pinxianii TaxID=2881052 RepID=UPI001CF47704|nr:sigma-70 family RNA polymerase sigma factor [Methylophaga pinxianii]MCB2426695.1 sigma-70 family RNA polymerase sigma factor [Methylophaga pinxianii]UPH44502.1 sigma-70 family RNA polymerase sigma factor [Methylophaga pinxianii]